MECEKQQLVELNQGMERWSNERNELVKELEGHNQQVARLAEERLKLLEEIENSQQEVQQLGCRMNSSNLSSNCYTRSCRYQNLKKLILRRCLET